MKTLDEYFNELFKEKEIKDKNDLIKNKELIKEFADKCKRQELFIENKIKYDDFLLFVKRKSTENNIDPCIIALNHFIHTIITAPTSFYHYGSIILLIPTIDYFLHETGETPIEKNMQ